MLHCSSSLSSKILLKCDTSVSPAHHRNNAKDIKPKRKMKGGWKEGVTIFTKCKDASRKTAFSPEGEFHACKRKQKKNRAKSIREREKESRSKWRLHGGRLVVIGETHLEAVQKPLPVVWSPAGQCNMKWKKVGNGGTGGGGLMEWCLTTRLWGEKVGWPRSSLQTTLQLLQIIKILCSVCRSLHYSVMCLNC